jgi:KUP system potassium uptake protein
LGAVFLAVTGGEALYADMGHIGRKPIRTVWYAIVLPALLLNYAGQVALLLENPAMNGSPFFRLAPDWAILPLVLLATVATIVASQAIITGSFSLTRQAMQLRWLPGMHIQQTSADEYGQIYVPFVNWTMMLLTVAVAIGFGSSDRLAGAYGTAVSTTMLLTTVLLFSAMRVHWGWSMLSACAVAGAFFIVDVAFFSANLLKIKEGGWVPLVFGGAVFVLMITWRFGSDALHRKAARAVEAPEAFFARLRQTNIPRVRGTAIFLTRLSRSIPPLITVHVNQIGAIHETLVALTIRFEEVPRVGTEHRLDVSQLAENFWHVTARYGFVETPDLPRALRQAKKEGCPINLAHAIYFSGRDEVVRKQGGGRLAQWRVPVFAFMFRNSVHAGDRFNIPSASLVEMSRRIEI